MKKIAPLFIALCCLTGNVYSQDDAIKFMILPFAPYSWEDGLYDVISKTTSTAGIEQVELCIRKTCVPIANAKTKDDIGRKITELIKKDNELFLNPEDPRVRSNLEEYIDIKGMAKNYPESHSNYYVKARPIMISGVPFDIKLSFEPIKGLSVYSPDKVICDSGKLYWYPLLLTSMSLDSKSPSLASKFTGINEIIENKYRKYDLNKLRLIYEHDKGLSGELHGDTPSTLSIHCNSQACFISYESRDTANKLESIYTRHLSDIEQRALKGKKDSSGGL